MTESKEAYIKRMKQRYLDDFSQTKSNDFVGRSKKMPNSSYWYNDNDEVKPIPPGKFARKTNKKYVWYVPNTSYHPDDCYSRETGYDYDADDRNIMLYRRACQRCKAMKGACKIINQNGNFDKYLRFDDIANCGTEIKDDYWSLFKLEMNKQIGKIKKFVGFSDPMKV
jgi:hypothetical protein